MPKQIFEVVRAPEHSPFRAEILRQILRERYKQTEIHVTEIYEREKNKMPEISEAAKLKPCPICGSNELHSEGRRDCSHWDFVCEACGTWFSVPCDADADAKPHIEFAIEEMNKRPIRGKQQCSECAAKDAEIERLKNEKEVRIKYQDLVYKAMNLIDQKLSSNNNRYRCTIETFMNDLKQALAGVEGENTGRIEYDCECPRCNGTGLYVGMCERDGLAVVCNACKGRGWKHVVIEYKQADKQRKLRDDVTRVIETNPSICASVYFSFGGMSYADWLSGKQFERGMEMRTYTCPAWWYQCVHNELRPEWSECIWGGRFIDCKHFAHKERCWLRFDEANDREVE